MKIAVDCFGGDKSPGANVEGAVWALDRHDDLELVLTGDEAKIRDELSLYNYDTDRITVVHAPEIITGDDKPINAIRLKKESSMVKAIRLLREDKDIGAVVSTGASGALIGIATIRIGRIEGVRRPAFCPLLPTMTGGIVGVCDSGANVEAVTPETLVHNAILGTEYLKTAYAIESPRVALLNVGTEAHKGDELRQKTYQYLSELDNFNFVGNMESRDLLSGKYDLIVSDAFSGNVLVKSVEGTAVELLKKIKRDIYSKNLYKMGALLMKKMFKEEKEFMNYQNYGGSVLLGCEKVIVKGHGSSSSTAVSICIDQAYRMANSRMNENVASAIADFNRQQNLE